MTLAELNHLSEVAADRNKRDSLESTTLSRVAYHADKKGWDSVTKMLKTKPLVKEQKKDQDPDKWLKEFIGQFSAQGIPVLDETKG